MTAPAPSARNDARRRSAAPCRRSGRRARCPSATWPGPVMVLAIRQISFIADSDGLRAPPALPYKRAMAETTYFPRRLILAGAMISGVLLAHAVHMLGARHGLDLGGLWRADNPQF